MKPTHLSVIILLTILIVNVFTISWLFLPLDRNVSNAIWIFDLVGFTIASILFITGKKSSIPGWLGNTVLSGFSMLIVFMIIVLVDRTVICSFKTGLIFPAGTEAIYKSSEFNVSAKINQIGIRDYETQLECKSDYRVLAFGDSYTFGWGVDLENCWVKLVERNLNAQGLDIEILNMGHGGKFSRDYANYAEKAIPMLQPDVIIVGLLQGNDLYQAMRYNAPRAGRFGKKLKKQSKSELAAMIFRVAFPNTQKLIIEHTAPERQQVNKVWKTQLVQMIGNMTAEDKLRFDALSPEIQQLALNGMLNPPIIGRSIHRADMYQDLQDVNSPSVRDGVTQITNDLKRIKKVADQYGVEVLVISIPSKLYVSKDHLDFERENLCLNFPEHMQHHNTSDIAFESATGQAGLPLHKFTEDFIHASSYGDLFFRIDGHYNEEGNRLLSDLVSPLLSHQIAQSEKAGNSKYLARVLR